MLWALLTRAYGPPARCVLDVRSVRTPGCKYSDGYLDRHHDSRRTADWANRTLRTITGAGQHRQRKRVGVLSATRGCGWTMKDAMLHRSTYDGLGARQLMHGAEHG